VIVPGPAFTKTLKLGSSGTEVITLQQYLVSQGFLVIPTNIAQGYFGQMTRTALMAYQKSIGLSPVGELGPQTRAAILSGGHAKAAPTGKAVGLYTFTQSLQLGSKGEGVTKLQEILVAKGFLVMPPGILSGYFGLLTRQAVMEYQKSLGLEQVGIVGPMTRARLNTGMGAQ
jgi:peptidoglycan hydrolase-like protein with peptidoglycan-binding domain